MPSVLHVITARLSYRKPVGRSGQAGKQTMRSVLGVITARLSHRKFGGEVDEHVNKLYEVC